MRSSLFRVLGGVLIAVAVPIAVVLVLAVAILSVPPVGRFALSQVLVRGGPRFGMNVRFGRIEGNIMRSITITDFAARLGPDSLKVKELSLSYDPWTSIAHRTFSVSSARAKGPQLFIGRQRPATGGGGPARTQFPPVRIGQLRLGGGSVYLDSVRRLDSVDFILNLVSVPEQLEARLSDCRAHLAKERFSLEDLHGAARLTPDSLVVTDLVAMTGASLLRAGLRMAFRPSGIVVILDSLSVSLPELTSVVPVGPKAGLQTTGPKRPALGEVGRFRATGELELEKGQPRASIQYAAESLAVDDILIPTVTGRLGLEDSILRLTMTGADSALGSAEVAARLDLRKLDFSGSAKLTNVGVRRLQPDLPEVRVDAGIEVSGRATDSVSAKATARIPELGIERLALLVRMTNDQEPTTNDRRWTVDVEQFEMSGPAGDASGHGTWRAGRVQADVRMSNLDLAVLARMTNDQAPMTNDRRRVAGRVTGNLSLAGTADTLDVAGDLTVSGLAAVGVSAEKAHAGIAVAVGRKLSGQATIAADRASYSGTAVDSIRVAWDEERFRIGLWRPDGRLAAEGSARLARDSIGVDIAALRVTAGKETLTFSDVLRLELRRDSFDVRIAALGLAGGDVHVAASGAAGKTAQIDAAVTRLDLGRLKTMFGLAFDMSGTVSLNVAGSDSFDVGVEAEGLKIPSADAELSLVKGKARVSRTRAEFDHLWLVRSDGGTDPETSLVTGWLEYKTQGGFELGAANLRAELRNPGTWVVFYLKPTLELRQGTIYGELTVKGELMHPMFAGRVRISRARLAVPVIGTTFDRVNAELVFDRARISIEKLSGRSDHGSSLVTGFVDIGRQWQVDSLRFHGDFSGTTINPMPEIYGTIGGSLDLSWTFGQPFSLSGTVNVEEALITLGFGQSAGPGTGAPDTLFTYDVRVKGDRNIWLRNQFADIELTCDLAVRRTTREASYSGELTSRQGSIYYLDHTLRVDSGSVRFENINTLNPELYITAGMPVRAAMGGQGAPDSVVVTLTGTLEKPSFEFRSVPPIWDESEILSYLTLNATPEQLASATDQKAAVNTLLSQRLLSYFQTQASKRARGFVNLDYLQFESGWLTGKETKVTVGKYVGRNLYVSYSQNFTGVTTPSFRVEYYVDRRNEIVAEGTAQGTPDERYRTSLRYQLRFRY